ncbi:MAG: Gfo/Idh/MocA family oxidoreductase [Oscillospiraceae bacterium]|nr:Gfo/Idh/MocA family oxidoreductase [Blautia sp.]MBR3001852.1 Gfo/Idh/MocA family oxidoreductase [Oscillospiraceae bacterium]
MKWGILATGSIAKKFASTILAMKDEGEALVAVGSRSLEKAKAFAEEHRIPTCYGSYQELAQAPDVEAVYVATPNNLHYENCRMCLLAGKHVLCEKPFTLRPEQAEELYSLAKEKGLFLMEAFWIRLLPLYDALIPMLRDGRIGEIREIRVQYGFTSQGARRERKFRSELGGGALLDIGIYNLGFLQMVTGTAPLSFSTQTLRLNEFRTDAYSDITLVYANGCTAHSIQTIGQELERNALITGTLGTVFLEDFQHAVQMTIKVQGQEEETLTYPMDINGFEYEIREASRCAAMGKFCSDIYPPKDSIALSQLLFDIRQSWNMQFDGE